MKLDFIGIGAQKAATSWIYKCLLEHPEICGFHGKETYFFTREKRYAKGLEFYASLFEHCDKDKIIGEFSTTYLSSDKAAQRIKEYFPNIKLLACLRDPVERAQSHILHLESKNKRFRQMPVEELIKKRPQVVEAGMYGKHVEGYFKLFSRENILILFYEDIKQDPGAFMQKIYAFLGADKGFVPSSAEKRYHTSRARLSPWHKKINRTYLKLKEERAGQFLIKGLRAAGINSNTVYKFLDKTGEKTRQFTGKDKRYLYNFYKDDIKKLERLLDKDLGNWKK